MENIYYTYYMSLLCFVKAVEALKNEDTKKAEVYIRNGKIFSFLLMSSPNVKVEP